MSVLRGCSCCCLLIAFLLLKLCVGFGFGIHFCCVALGVLPSIAIIWQKRGGCCALTVWNGQCYESLPRGVVGLPAFCDWCMPLSCLLSFKK